MGYGNLEWLKLGYNLEFLPDAASFGLLSDIAPGGGDVLSVVGILKS